MKKFLSLLLIANSFIQHLLMLIIFMIHQLQMMKLARLTIQICFLSKYLQRQLPGFFKLIDFFGLEELKKELFVEFFEAITRKEIVRNAKKTFISDELSISFPNYAQFLDFSIVLVIDKSSRSRTQLSHFSSSTVQIIQQSNSV